MAIKVYTETDPVILIDKISSELARGCSIGSDMILSVSSVIDNLDNITTSYTQCLYDFAADGVKAADWKYNILTSNTNEDIEIQVNHFQDFEDCKMLNTILVNSVIKSTGEIVNIFIAPVFQTI